MPLLLSVKRSSVPALLACPATCGLQREAYERAGVASAHAIILGSLQAEDLKDADARMLTSLLMVQVGWRAGVRLRWPRLESRQLQHLLVVAVSWPNTWSQRNCRLLPVKQAILACWCSKAARNLSRLSCAAAVACAALRPHAVPPCATAGHCQRSSGSPRQRQRHHAAPAPCGGLCAVPRCGSQAGCACA